MQNRVERAGAEVISVPPQLLDHAKTEDLAFGRMAKDVQSDEASIQIRV